MNAAAEVKGTWAMMDNDQIGDCTCAAAGHLIMEWTAAAQSKMRHASGQADRCSLFRHHWLQSHDRRKRQWGPGT
jgi:hypothetical protein